jgi:hypothetical protein
VRVLQKGSVALDDAQLKHLVARRSEVSLVMRTGKLTCPKGQ